MDQPMDQNFSADQSLSYHGVYPCPVCRVGQVQGLALMDAMACNFCRHIYTLNIEKQRLQMADREPPLVWHWTGKNWVGAHLQGVEIGWGYKLVGLLLVLLPPGIVVMAAYLFPPEPNQPLSNLPLLWAILTFLLHFAILLWLVLEFYQFPLQAYFRSLIQQFRR